VKNGLFVHANGWEKAAISFSPKFQVRNHISKPIKVPCGQFWVLHSRKSISAVYRSPGVNTGPSGPPLAIALTTRRQQIPMQRAEIRPSFFFMFSMPWDNVSVAGGYDSTQVTNALQDSN
jgi:hypothetical protein